MGWEKKCKVALTKLHPSVVAPKGVCTGSKSTRRDPLQGVVRLHSSIRTESRSRLQPRVIWRGFLWVCSSLSFASSACVSWVSEWHGNAPGSRKHVPKNGHRRKPQTSLVGRWKDRTVLGCTLGVQFAGSFHHPSFRMNTAL